MANEELTTRRVANLVGMRPTCLLTAIWNRRVPEPPRRRNGYNCDWTRETAEAVCRALTGQPIEGLKGRPAVPGDGKL
jgi:hypothetical protein